MDVRFEITPEDAWPTARAVIRWFRSRKVPVEVEKALNDEIPLRTTVVARDSGLPILVEAQHEPTYGRSIRDCALALAATREYAEFYVAVPEEASVSGALIQRLRSDGVGLIFVRADGELDFHIKPRNQALCVNPDPTLVLGARKGRVASLVKRFNDGDRKEALREMCELFEQEVTSLARKAARKQLLKKSEEEVERMDLHTKINVLAAADAYHDPPKVLVKASLKDDLQSFRTARNLVDHPVKTRRQEVARQRQYLDRMMMAPRLIAELTALYRKIR